MRAMLRGCVVLGLALVPALSGAAAVSQEEIRELRAQIAVLSARLAELERRAGEEKPPAPASEPGRAAAPSEPVPAPAAPPAMADRGDHWTDRVDLKGDFRYRWETIDREGSDSRERHRIRARPTLTARVNDTVRVGFGLATGGDNPVSGNQTIGDGGARLDIGLDQAWFEWTGLPGTRLVGEIGRAHV